MNNHRELAPATSIVEQLQFKLPEATMDDLRQYHRITCDAKCILYHAHSKFSGMILNISLSGVAVKIYDSQADPMQVGESCSLILCNNPSICTYRYPVQIARIGSPVIGLQFVDAEA